MSTEVSAMAPHRLCNKNGMEVDVLPYGGIIQRLTAADFNGNYADVVLGFDTVDQYLGKHPYFGALIGRYANRIANSRVEIDGNVYQLTPGKNGNHLHGGATGFDKVLWHVETSGTDEQSLRLSHYQSGWRRRLPGRTVGAG